MLKLTCTFLLLFSYSIFSQILSKKQETAIRNTIAAQFGEAHAQSYMLHMGAANFQYLNGDTLFNPHGFHYVFRLTADTLERLDNSLFHGNDNHRFLFTHHNNLYALGGYGFFTTNNHLKYFNAKLKEWCFVKTKGTVPPFILGPAYKQGNYIYSFNNFKSGNNVEPDSLDANDYRLDLETMQWQRVISNMENHTFFSKPQFIYTKDYLVLLKDLKTMVIAPHLNKYIVISNEDFGIGTLSKLNLVNGNSCTFNRFNEIRSSNVVLDFDNIWKANITRAKDIVWNVHEPSNTNVIFMIIMACIILASAMGIYRYVKRKPKPTLSNDIETEESKELILQPVQAKVESHTDHKELKRIAQLFIDLNVSEINWDEMDKMLNISHLEGDSRKLRRHRLLKDFPEGMITRNKAEIDKRRFMYLINRSILENFYNTKL
jgi:hypothetical protein